MKIIAFSDLHIHTHRFGAGVDPATGRHSRLQDCLNVLDVTAQACFDHDAAARVFCGDLFHVRGQIRPSWLNPALDHFRRFHGSHAYWDIMIPGNHDMEHRADGEHALEALKPIAGVRVFEGFGYDVLEINRPAGEILGIGWVQYAPDVKELKRRVDQVAAMKRTWAGPKPKHTLMMIHHGVDGVMPGIPDMGFTASCLPTDDFDVVLCGDYHNHKQLAPNAWMIGAPLHHTFGDAGQKRGYMVIDFEKRTAELVEVPAQPYKNPNNYVRYSGRLAEELARTEPNGAIWANQFDNTANRRAHLETTGPEIWEQTGGKVDGFICAVGSGGTLAGVADALQPKGVKIGLADPEGAALYSFYTEGVFESPGSSITEGIGQGRITANLEGFTPDFAYRIPDAEALPVIFDLLEHEGLCLGGSSGINVAGAIRMARDMGPGHTIVTVLCDYGTRYQTKLFNPDFLHAKGLPVPRWMARKPADLPEVFED